MHLPIFYTLLISHRAASGNPTESRLQFSHSRLCFQKLLADVKVQMRAEHSLLFRAQSAQSGHGKITFFLSKHCIADRHTATCIHTRSLSAVTIDRPFLLCRRIFSTARSAHIYFTSLTSYEWYYIPVKMDPKSLPAVFFLVTETSENVDIRRKAS